MGLKLSIYDVLVKAIITEKAYTLYSKFKKVILEVHVSANKILVAEAVKKLFAIEAKDINIIVKKGKRRVSKSKNISIGKTKKIAIVTLKDGYDVNFFGELINQKEALSSK